MLAVYLTTSLTTVRYTCAVGPQTFAIAKVTSKRSREEMKEIKKGKVGL